MQKIAVITGILGNGASALAELLLDKGYKVIGVRRRSSNPNFENIRNIIDRNNFEIVVGDITDFTSIRTIILDSKCDELYNLAAQSFVKASFEQPFHTFDVDTIGVLNILEVLRQEKLSCRLSQNSTSEMFGKSYDVRGSDKYQDENTKMSPQSPYGVSKLASHHLVRLYREAYGVQACCNIFFNFEGPNRGKEFVTRKITDYVGQLYHVADKTSFKKLALGNLDAYRDWSHVKDVVRAQHLTMQQEVLEDFVICSEETRTVREFCEIAFSYIGLDYRDFVVIDPAFYRPAEVDILKGDCTKAKTKLGWKPEFTFVQLIEEMLKADISRHTP